MNKIISKEQFSEKVFKIEVEAPLIAKSRKAGHFVIVRVGEKGERMPLTIAEADPVKGTITLVVQKVGLSSTRLCELNVGDEVTDIVGPLGQATHIEHFGTVVCAGGGVGVAPMLPIIQALKAAGKRLFVATSKPEVYARRIIEHFDLDQYFEYVAGMELDGGRGSKAEVIGYLIDTCRMQDKKRILMIGDREHDVLGAKQEGLDCMGVLYGFGNREELEKAGAVYVAGTPEDIAGIILK